MIAVTERTLSISAAAATEAVDTDRHEAFGRLAAAELGASYQLAARILGNPGDAEDAVHEAILRAWAAFDRLRDPDSFKPWLMRIVVNVCRNDLRHRRVLRMEPLGRDERAAPDQFEGSALREAVAQAMGCLKPDERVVVVLRYWNDLTVNDIARIVGTPSGTVKWRLHTANRRIEAELSRFGWEITR